MLNQEEIDYRMETYHNTNSTREMAEVLGITLKAASSWLFKNHLPGKGNKGRPKGTKKYKPHKIKRNANDKRSLSNEENEYRLSIYWTTKSDVEMAEILGLSNRAIQTWRNKNRLPAKIQQHKKRKRPNYVSRQPQWERDLIRRFASDLIRYQEKAESIGKQVDVLKFTNVWRDIYGSRELKELEGAI